MGKKQTRFVNPVIIRLKSWSQMLFRKVQKSQQQSTSLKMKKVTGRRLDFESLFYKVFVKISHLPSKLRFSAKYSFFGQSLSQGPYQPTHQPPEGRLTWSRGRLFPPSLPCPGGDRYPKATWNHLQLV